MREQREELSRRDATFRELYSSPKARIAVAEELVAALDAAEFDTAVVVGIGWSGVELAQEANDYVLEAAAKFPGRIIPFCDMNPAWGDTALLEAERCLKAGAKGVGELHPDEQGFDITSGGIMSPLMELARKAAVPVLVHASEPVGHTYPGKGRTAPERLTAFISQYPYNAILCAHWGGGLPFYALMPEMAQVLRNVYYDTAASPFLYDSRVFRAALELVGHERILFGTDYPLIGHRRLLSQLSEAALPQEAVDAIVGGNAVRLLRLKEAGR